MLEEVIKRTRPSVDSKARPGQSEAPPHLPCPWNVPSAHNSHSGSPFQEHSLEKVRCCWDHLDDICDWTHLRSLCKLLRSVYLVALKTSLICKFPCLLKLPPANLECFAFFRFSLSSVCRGPVSDFTWELLKLWTNISTTTPAVNKWVQKNKGGK